MNKLWGWRSLSQSGQSFSSQGRVLGIPVWAFRHRNGYGIDTNMFAVGVTRSALYGPDHRTLTIRVGRHTTDIGNGPLLKLRSIIRP